MKKSKYFILLVFILLISCSSKSNLSFDMLESAFFKWYNKSHFFNVNYKSAFHPSFPKIENEQLYEEYIGDLSRFELELSQIDEFKLKEFIQI